MNHRKLHECKRGYCRHEVAGVNVDDSARKFATIHAITRDPRLADCERAGVIASVFPDVPSEKLPDVLWEAFGLDFDGTHGGETLGGSAFDWDEDAGRIRSSLLMAYGFDWDEKAGSTPFRDVLDMLSGLMESGETPFQQAVMYRTAKPPRRNKYNSDAVDAFNARAEHFALKRDDDPYGDEIFRRMKVG